MNVKLLLAVCLAAFTSLAGAQVLEVNIWKPKMGGTEGTMAAAKEAAGIIKAAGGNASIGADFNGSLHFVTFHENWAAWAAHTARLSDNADWSAFVAKWNAAPTASLEDNYLLNTAVAGGAGDVYQVFIWEAFPGRGSALFEAGAQAKALHEKDGAAITIYSDQMQRMHYVMNFESWEAWARFQDADHPEFQAFMREREKDPAAKLVKVYTASMQ